MWNPFRAIGNAIGSAIDRVLGREESAAPQPEQQPEPQESAIVTQPEPQEREERGFLGRMWDRVSGAERERQLEERERQLEERERQLEAREQAIAAPAQSAPEPAVPAQPAPEPAVPAQPERELPKFAGGDGSEFLARDERAFGTDSEIGRELEDAVADFIADRGGLDGLSADAREWLQVPTVSEPFSDYWQSGGFSADQVLAGMTNISNIKISEGEDGDVHIEFDYDSEVDGYEVHGHASS